MRFAGSLVRGRHGPVQKRPIVDLQCGPGAVRGVVVGEFARALDESVRTEVVVERVFGIEILATLEDRVELVAVPPGPMVAGHGRNRVVRVVRTVGWVGLPYGTLLLCARGAR